MFNIVRTIAGQTSTKFISRASRTFCTASSVPEQFQFDEKPDIVHSAPNHTVYWHKNDGCVIKDPNGNFQYGMRFMPDGKTTCYHADGTSYQINGIQEIVQKHFAETGASDTPYGDAWVDAYMVN